uniref:Uncharacterized protein n=1 Tax=Solanum lycopersicum TaxID=4081 RepID=A0A3Q7JWX7_SOLLC
MDRKANWLLHQSHDNWIKIPCQKGATAADCRSDAERCHEYLESKSLYWSFFGCYGNLRIGS